MNFQYALDIYVLPLSAHKNPLNRKQVLVTLTIHLTVPAEAGGLNNYPGLGIFYLIVNYLTTGVIFLP
jgi:hypothetical protein